MVIIMQNSDVFEKDRKYIAHTYHRFPAAIKNGHGAQAEDYEGKKYIDFGSGIGTNSLGFCNSKWVHFISQRRYWNQKTGTGISCQPW